MKTRANGFSRAPHIHRGDQSQTPFYDSMASQDVAGWLTKAASLKRASSIVVEFTNPETANAVIYAGMVGNCCFFGNRTFAGSWD
jgi:hypothetical protein